jgi:hypothetical protein
MLLVVSVWVFLPAREISAQDADVHSAHVVVVHADGTAAVRPITWTGAITRVAALQAAGLAVAAEGDVVCNIEGEGCPASDCMCTDNLWAQGQWDGSAWDSAAWPPPELADGDVVAFRNGAQPDYSDWGLEGFMPGAATYVAASDALEWMRGQQAADGSYADAFGAMGPSTRALIALGASGYDPGEWGSPSLLEFMTVISRTEVAEYAGGGTANAGMLAVGAAWTGQDVHDFAGVDLPIAVAEYYSPTTGGYGGGSGDTTWAVLGLAAMGEPIREEAVGFLKGVQNPDGGWAWNEWGPNSEVQHTAMVVQALLVAGEGVTSTEIISAQTFIDSGKNDDGGYAYQPSGPSDANTTSAVVQAQLAVCALAGDPLCAASDIGYLLDLQEADGSYAGASALYSTQEAIPALLQRAHAVRPAQADAPGPNQVGLVVRLGDEDILTRCVEFDEDEISGHEVLVRAGLQVVASLENGNESTICSIEEVGCPANNCFCQCSGSTCTYWSYWHLVDGEWLYSQFGADGQTVEPGAVEGWSWGEEVAPPVISLEEICAPAAAATLVPTVTLPPATATAAPTGTPTEDAGTTEEMATPTQASALTATSSPTAAAEGVEATATPAPDEADGGARGWIRYALFGVLIAVLVGVGIAIWVRRGR